MPGAGLWGEMGLMGSRVPSLGLEGQPGREKTHGLLWGFHPQKVIPDHLNWFVLVFGLPHPSTYPPTQPNSSSGCPRADPDWQLLGLFKPLIYPLDTLWKCKRDFILLCPAAPLWGCCPLQNGPCFGGPVPASLSLLGAGTPSGLGCILGPPGPV